ncbi:MAG TPA: hypothetical protein VGU46_07055 [Acidobacteriaceae bacterium]|nr:hypothetical protein [Acidobacteriaceae bacterium]
MQPKTPQVESVHSHLPVSRELSTASKLRLRIGSWKKNLKPTLDEARHAAADLARREQLNATEADIEDAATFSVFSQGVRDGDLAMCEPLAQHSFQTMRDDPTHILVHRDWVQLLLHSHRFESADSAALSYLEYIHQWDQTASHTQSALTLWGRLLQANLPAMPKSAAYSTANFAQVHLGPPPG